MKNHLRIRVPLKVVPAAGDTGTGASRSSFAKEGAGMPRRANPSNLQVFVPFRDVARVGAQGRKVGGLYLADKAPEQFTAHGSPDNLRIRFPLGWAAVTSHAPRAVGGFAFATEGNLALAVPVGQGDSSEPMGRNRPWPAKDYYEVGIESFFNARHYTKIDGGVEEVHHHSWRVRVILSVNGKEYSGRGLQYPDLKEKVEKELGVFSNTILNNVFPFTEIDPTPESVAGVLTRKFRTALEIEGVTLKSLVLWESPVYYVEYSEGKS